MHMELILWRHAEAEDGFPDLARELTGKGRKQARQMADWLIDRLPQDTRILVSPAARTRQTAEFLGLDFSILEELAPGAPAGQLLAVAGWPAGPHNVLIVGHQPTLGEAAALAMTGNTAGWGVKKGGLWWLSSRSRLSPNECVLRAVIAPDLL